MCTKPYGNTGKDVSVIGCGGMRFASPIDMEASAEIILHAYNKGINYFDTAPFYCDDKSEEIFGAAFKQMQPDTFYTSTKCSSPDGGELRKSLERSLERLGVEKITFFHIWCVYTLEVWQSRLDGGAVAAAFKAKEEGLIEHVCVSSHMPGDDFLLMLDDAPLDGFTLGYCAINSTYRQAAIDLAGRRGLGVVTMNPLGGGLIPQNAERFDFLRGPNDRSVVEAALRFNVSQPAISCALVGFSEKSHVDQAVAAVENFEPYDKAHLDKIQNSLKGSTGFNDLCTCCKYCLPCPAGINVPAMMDAYNYRILQGDKPENVLNRLKWHWSVPPESAADCTDCGLCEEHCTQHLPICERLKHIASLPKLPAGGGLIPPAGEAE